MVYTDKRIEKTEALIRQAFFQLLQTTGYENISVTMLCEKANINRKTFYYHYETLDALLDYMVEELIPETRSACVLDTYMKYQTLGASPAFEAYYRTVEYEYFRPIQDSKEQLAILISPQNYNAFIRVLSRKVSDNIPYYVWGQDYENHSSPFDEIKIDLCVSFIVSLIQWGLKHPELSIEEIIEHIHDFSLHLYYLLIRDTEGVE